MSQRWSAVLVVLLAGCAPAAPPATPAPAIPAARIGLERPLPQPVVPPAEFRRAVARGTRTETGAPGPNYWQQWTRYRISATVDPARKRLDGTAQLVYHNRSPDTLAVLFLHLYQNLHAPGAVRNEFQEVTGSVELRRLAVAGRTLDPGAVSGPGYEVEGTVLAARPERPLLPGDSVAVEVEWGFTIPRSGAGRMGWDGDDLLFLAYWYPQMAVYDDVVGWQVDQYLGAAEFYLGFADYDVTLTLPEEWVVRATGELQNAEQLLAPEVLERLRSAERSDEVVHVLTAADLEPGRATRRGGAGRLAWHFRAENMRDFSFGATRRFLWDATRTPVGDRSGDGETDYARIEALYRPSAPRWAQVARYQRHAIDFLSRFTGFPYPWPHMTAVEGGGIITGGMEFPMMTLMGDYNVRADSALYYVTAHELAHMWVPMIVGSDEKRYGWIDEGATTFAENEARMEFFPGRDHHDPDRQQYLEAALAGIEGEMMRWTDFHYPGPAMGVASYAKPASVLVALRGVLGEEIFMRAYRTFLRSWAYRHPTPWDLFHSFESVSGEDLGWFWRSWYYETWVLDHAVESVTTGSGGTTIVVSDLGEIPMPVHLTITHADGEVVRREIPVQSWLAGLRTASILLPAGPSVVRVEIDAEHAFPDVDRANNLWTG
ncbi:M1 family metallopeptidase [soil metagenome]